VEGAKAVVDPAAIIDGRVLVLRAGKKNFLLVKVVA